MSLTSISEAHKEQSTHWFDHLKPRWVDIIGSYAGKELFVVDGDALIQSVLDDPLLALGKPDSLDWQILHAFFNLESFLHQLRRRGSVFDIVFFKSNGAFVVGTSKLSWRRASRSLAHKLLRNYVESLDLTVYIFKDQKDPEWREYALLNKPLFMLTSDGAISSEVVLPEVLLQREFMRDVMSLGLLVGSLREIDFRDSHAFTFLYNKIIPFAPSEATLQALQQARELLEEQNPTDDEEEDSESDSSVDVQSWPIHAVQHYISSNSSNPLTLPLLFAFIAHVFVLDTIDLELRSQPTPILNETLTKLVTEEFLPTMYTSLEATLPSYVEEPPSIDGRVFSLLLSHLLSPDADAETVLGSGVYSKVTSTWQEFDLAPVDFGSLRQHIGTHVFGKTIPLKEFQEFSLFPFEAPIIENALEAVDVPSKAIDDFGGTPTPLFEFSNDSIFWPSRRHQSLRSPLPKHLGGEDLKPKDRRAKDKLLRGNQRFMSNIERQANSLTGAKGAKLEQEVITAVGTTISSRPSSRSETPDLVVGKGKKAAHQQSKPPKKVKEGAKSPKQPPMKSADKLRAQIELQKKAKSVSETETWWKQRLEELKTLAGSAERIEMLELQLKNKRMEDPELASQVWLYRIHLECTHWIDNPKRNERSVHDGYVVRLLKMVKNMAAYQLQLTPTMVKCLWSVLEAIGFEDYISIIAQPPKGAADKKLAYDFVKFYKKSKDATKAGAVTSSYPWMEIKEDPVDWQLRVFGEHMDRSFDSKPDNRVKFEPDGWQRDVLDKLDRNESVLVVAPTSAGKTFISYYAMKQVLTASDDSVLVYVAPTKALVSQITAEVYARYRKDMKGRSCWGIYTADVRMNNPLTCQILVTVPEMLAFMLLSPSLAKIWTPRIKRIILDEIHTLGSQPGGVWEQILLLARCPIIGLSATVGEAELFNEWLKSIQEAHGHVHTLVQHQHRYSHLRKFSYILSSEPEILSSLPSHTASDRIKFLHPISFVRPGLTELPSDLALEARDCATLYKAMHQVSKDPSLESLEPTTFFESLEGVMLQQKDIIKYEIALKAKLNEWLAEDDANEPTSTIQRVVKLLSDPKVGTEESEDPLSNNDAFYSNLLPFLSDLHATGDLPAILFHFDRYTVEAMAKAILESLKQGEAEWRKTSPEYEKKVKGWQAWEAGAKERERAAQRAAAKSAKAEGDKMERMAAAAAVDSSPLAMYANFDPNAPSDEFTFINWGTRYSASELDDDLKGLERWTTTPKILIEALRRGIAVHHSGLNRRYRSLVESLFRIGFCRIVISTEDLALGVNMPAKASVFCGDSPALTALMYRQCAGRAGRRGFDLLGKVIFYGIPHERVKQVVLSKLPALRGTYPLTPTLSLRLINLLSESSGSKTASNAVRDLLQLERLTVGSDISRDQTLYNLRFSIEYLIRARLLNSAGSPLYPWYSFASFLYDAEPGNLAFLSLFRSGYIHRLCEQSLLDAKRDIMHILAFLFNRDYLSKTNFDKEAFAKNNRTPSKVILPPLQKEAYDILSEHNAEVLTVFTECAVTYAIQHGPDLGLDNALPFSGRRIEVTSTTSSSSFLQQLKRSRTHIRSRSAFVATSGHGDVYNSIDELVSTVRSDIHLTKLVLPAIDSFAPGDQEARYINAYLYDFYLHGQDKPLVDANNIPKGEIWYRLHEFSMNLDSIVTSIVELLQKDSRRGDDDMTSVADTDLLESTGPAKDWAADLEKDEAAVSSGPSGPGPLEKEKGEDAEATANAASRVDSAVVRPPHVTDRDWRVYEVFFQVQVDFNEKFKAMWA